MTPEQQAIALAAWLEENPGAPPPEGLDPDVIEAVYALRPDLAPPPRVTADDILASVTTGPLAEPPPSAIPPAIAPPPTPVAPANRPRWRGPAMVGAIAALAAMLLVSVQVTTRSAREAPGAPVTAAHETRTEESVARDELQPTGDRAPQPQEDLVELDAIADADAPTLDGPAIARGAIDIPDTEPAAEQEQAPQAAAPAPGGEAIAGFGGVGATSGGGARTAAVASRAEPEAPGAPAASPAAPMEADDGAWDAVADLGIEEEEDAPLDLGDDAIAGGFPPPMAEAEPVAATTEAATVALERAEEGTRTAVAAPGAPMVVALEEVASDAGGRRRARPPRPRGDASPAAADADSGAQPASVDEEARHASDNAPGAGDPVAEAFQRAAQHEAAGRWVLAAQALRPYVGLPPPDGPEIAARVAENYQRAGRWQEVRDVAARRLALGVVDRAIRERLEVLLAQADAALDASDAPMLESMAPAAEPE